MTKLNRSLITLTSLLLAVLCTSVPVAAQQYRGETTEIKVDSLPGSVEEFLVLRDRLATTPEGGAAVFVVALLKYAEDQALGEQFLTVAIDGKWLVDRPNGYKGRAPGPRYMQALRERIAGKPYVARSYVQGSSPENNYAVAAPFTIKILEQSGDKSANAKARSDNGLVKLFVYSTGADRPRPLQVNQNDKGLWKAYNWGSLEAGVRPPVVTQSDDI
jgi:hypothetical protein